MKVAKPDEAGANETSKAKQRTWADLGDLDMSTWEDRDMPSAARRNQLKTKA